MDEAADQFLPLLDLAHDSRLSLLESALDALALRLAEAVSSYVGLRLTISSHGHPVVVNTLTLPPDDGAHALDDPSRPALTSLRVPLVLLGDEFEQADQIVIFAATPGALLGLAGDLMDLLAHGARTSEARARPAARTNLSRPRAAIVAIALDADLPFTKVDAGLRGLSELSDIRQVEGVMIDHGHSPDEVGPALRRKAAAARLSPHAYAFGLLHGLTSGDGDEPRPRVTKPSCQGLGQDFAPTAQWRA